MNWLKARLSEGSTWAGLAVVVGGVGQLAKVEEAQPIAEAVNGVAVAIAAGVSPWAAAVAALFGVVAVIVKK